MWSPFNRFTEQHALNANAGRHAAGRGLWFVRSQDGQAVWEITLRIRGRSRDLQIGTYPELSAKAAHAEAAKWRSLAGSGLDPSAEQEAFRDAAARNLHQFYS